MKGHSAMNASPVRGLFVAGEDRSDSAFRAKPRDMMMVFGAHGSCGLLKRDLWTDMASSKSEVSSESCALAFKIVDFGNALPRNALAGLHDVNLCEPRSAGFGQAQHFVSLELSCVLPDVSLICALIRVLSHVLSRPLGLWPLGPARLLAYTCSHIRALICVFSCVWCQMCALKCVPSRALMYVP